MLDRLKGTLAAAIRWSPLPALVRTFWARRRVSILFYHDPDPAVLARHLEYLSRRYRFVSLRQAVDAVERGDLSALAPRPLVITFDDGHRGTFDLLALFQRFDVTPTIYLCSRIVGTGRHFWFTEARAGVADDVRDLKRLPEAQRRHELVRRLGFDRDREYPPETRQALSREEIELMREVVDFEAHTRYHPVLPTCSERDCEDEIVGARSDMATLLGEECAHFSYPNGDYGEREREVVRAAGYRSARSIDIGWNGRRADLLALRVLGTPDDASVARLAADLSGFGFLLRLRGGSARGRHRKVEVAKL